MTKKILLIDNNDFSALYFRDVFWIHSGKDGNRYEVVTVRDLTGAKEFLDSTDPVAVFVEPNAPNIRKDNKKTNHLEVAKFISSFKKTPQGQKIPVVAYSSFDDKDMEEEMIGVGANAFLVKGKHSAEDLVIAVDEIITKYQA